MATTVQGPAPSGAAPAAPRAVFEIEGLHIDYTTELGVLHAVRDVSLTVHEHESFGLVGESGSGKSTLAMGAIRYLASNGAVTDGSVRLNGVELLGLPAKQLRELWGSRIGVVYQSPLSALNPSIVIGKQLAEVARQHLGMDASAAKARVVEMLTKVAMPDPEAVMKRYPHQLSGGMLQRCVIAMALMTNPSLLIMDEPTTALDVTTQAVVLDLVAELKREFDSAILYITHDLGVITKICDRVGRHVRRRVHGAGRPARAVHAAAAPVHARPSRLRAALRPHAGEALARDHPRGDPARGRAAAGLHLRAALRVRARLLHHGAPAARPGRAGAPLRLPALVGRAAAGRVPARGDRGRPHGRRRGVRRPACSSRPTAPQVHFKAPKGVIRAVDGVDLEVRVGETLGVVGESGSGKTTVARAIIGLTPATGGEITLRGKSLPRTTGKRPRSTLREIQMVFQNPDASLNPTRTVGDAIMRPLSLLAGVGREEAKRRAQDLLRSVSLPVSYFDRLPHELSGGEKQRVAIARAFAAEPELILCDEPISSLDVSVQGSLMNLLMQLQVEKQTSYLFISHDLSAVQHLSDAIAVVYLGHVMEIGDATKVLTPPFHPYTEALLSAVPLPDPDVKQKPIRLGGSVPSAMHVPSGCRFHPRCPRFLGDICVNEEPPWREGEGDHRIYCHIPLDELARLQAETLVFGDDDDPGRREGA